jgi:hypothetical protein
MPRILTDNELINISLKKFEKIWCKDIQAAKNSTDIVSFRDLQFFFRLSRKNIPLSVE